MSVASSSVNAANPKALVWKSDWPVPWSSLGRIAAIVRTTLMMTPAKPMPVRARVATMTSGTSMTIQLAMHAA